jgi:type I restriction enzyme R subunit
MANNREAQFQWDITKAMSAGGWEYVSWLELPHYRLIKREEERLLLEEACLTSVNDVRSGKPHDPEKQRLAGTIDWLKDLYGAEVSDHEKLSMPLLEAEDLHF